MSRIRREQSLLSWWPSVFHFNSLFSVSAGMGLSLVRLHLPWELQFQYLDEAEVEGVVSKR